MTIFLYLNFYHTGFLKTFEKNKSRKYTFKNAVFLFFLKKGASYVIEL